MKFDKILLNWYLPNSRDLPWRKTKNPYNIWLSEIMLQQTRISQGLPYYNKFVAEFPTVFDLAKASEEKVLKLWQGLGYYSRARNLHFTAKYIADELKGVFPDNYKDLKKLKGVGDYTAAAIASICFEEPVAVVDGNVYRVLSRVFGIDLPINSTEGIKRFKTLAQKLLNKENPSNYNQSIMEFGALQCKPKNPLCGNCPLQENCVAFQQGKIERLPVKIKKTKVRTRHFNYVVIISEGDKTLLHQRTGKGIWKNLFQFPLIETKEEVYEASFVQNETLRELLGEQRKNLKLFNNKPIKHVLSHQKLFVKFWVLHLRKQSFDKIAENKNAINVSDIEDYPVPVIIEKFIEAFNFSK